MEWELTGVKWGRLADRDRDRRLADIGVYRTPVAILALNERLKDLCLVACGLWHWGIQGWFRCCFHNGKQ